MATNTDDFDTQEQLDRLESIGLGSDAVTDITIETDGVSVRKAIGDYGDHSRIGFVLTSTHEQPVQVTVTDSLPASVSVGRIGFHPDFYGDSWESTGDDRVTFTRELDPGQSLTTLYGIELTDDQSLQAFHHPPAISAQPTGDPDSDEGDDSDSQQGADQEAIAARMADDGDELDTTDIDLTDDDSQDDVEQAVGDIDISVDGDSGDRPRNVDPGELDSAISSDHSIDLDDTVSGNGVAATNGGTDLSTPSEPAVSSDGDLDIPADDGELELGEPADQSDGDGGGGAGSEQDLDMAEEDLVIGDVADQDSAGKEDLDPDDEEDLELGGEPNTERDDELVAGVSDEGVEVEDGASESEIVLEEPDETDTVEDSDDAGTDSVDHPDDADTGPVEDSVEEVVDDESGADSSPPSDESVLDALVRELDERELTDQQRQTLADAIGVEGGRSDEGHESGRSDEVRLDHIHARVDELMAYRNALETFIDANGTAPEVIESFESELDDVRSEMSTIDETLADTTDALDDLEAEIDATAADLADTDDELQDVRERLEDLQSVSSTVDELEALTGELGDDIAALEDAVESNSERFETRLEEFDDRVDSQIEELDDHVDSRLADLDDRVADTEASFEKQLESVQRELEALQDTVDEGAEWRSAINQSFLNVADIPGQSPDEGDVPEQEL